MSHSKSLGIPWENVENSIMPKVVKPAKSAPVAPKHKYTQRQLDTLAQARPILYKQVVAEGYVIVPEPQRVSETRQAVNQLDKFFSGLATTNPKAIEPKKAKKTMTTENTAIASTEAPVAKKGAAKKAVKKVVKKTVVVAKPAKKVAKKAAPAKAEAKTPGTVGAVKKDGLRKGQERILTLLAKKPEVGLGRNDIAEKAPVDVSTLTELIGSHDEAKRLANDVKHFPSLISLKYVKAEQHEGEPVLYKITAAGKAVAAKIE